MTVEWTALGTVVAVSLGAGVGVVVLFALGVRALAQRSEPSAGATTRVAATVGAVACFAGCVAAVVYGLYVIVWAQLSQLLG